MLMSPSVLYIPVLGEPFVVRMDASNTHKGAIFEKSGQPVAYYSHKLLPMECNYPVIDQKLLAIFLTYQQWCCYLHGAESTVVYTDHKVLVHLFI